ncbi:MAG: NfeD family protein [Micrococcales bacterium]|nr:NfeD family protein [Micrococcales bacterium]
MAWLWWLGIALVFGIAEMLLLTLVLIMFAGGALAAALAALLGVPLWGQVLTMAVVSALLLAALRPWLLRNWRRRTPLVETNVAGYVGRTAVVVVPVDAAGGRVKLTGQVWTARTEAGVVVPAGASVRVVQIDGATAVVVPLEAG